MKMLCVFEKKPRLRMIGHLDLMRAMQRALRRSGLPIAFSQGFNPHVLVTFAAPLSLGMAGERELMEVPLSESISDKTFLYLINLALPCDLQCLSARPVHDAHPAPMALLRAASFRAEFPEGAPALFEALPSFLAREEIPAIRKTKTGDKPCDIRPMIYDLRASGEHMDMTLALCEAATCKPDLLISSLCEYAGVEKPRCVLTRTRLWASGMRPLEDV